MRRTLAQRLATILGLVLAGLALGLFSGLSLAHAKKKVHPFYFHPPSRGSSFGASWDSWLSAYTTPGESRYSNDLALSYSYSPDKQLSFEMSDTLAQSAQANGKQEADFEDMWLTTSYRIPVSNAKEPFVFRTAASALLPASRVSQEAGMTHALSLLGEVSWRTGRWSVRQTNAGYLYFYNHELSAGDTSPEDPATSDEDESFMDEIVTEENPIEGESRTAYQNVHKLIVSHRLTRAATLVNTARFSMEWKESLGTVTNPEELSLSSRLDYDWTGEFETFAGFKTMTDLASGTSAPLFDGRSCSVQLGFTVSL